MARSSCASSGGGRRLTLPESPAAFLKANTRFVKNQQSKMCIGINNLKKNNVVYF